MCVPEHNAKGVDVCGQAEQGVPHRFGGHVAHCAVDATQHALTGGRQDLGGRGGRQREARSARGGMGWVGGVQHALAGGRQDLTGGGEGQRVAAGKKKGHRLLSNVALRVEGMLQPSQAVEKCGLEDGRYATALTGC